MTTTLRILSALIGLLFLVNCANWLINPAGAAAALGMPLLDGAGGNTQIGDLSAFFFALALFCLWGSWRQGQTWLSAAAILLAAAAAFRISAWAVHGTELVTSAVAVELICAVVLAMTAYQFRPAAQ